MKAEGAAQAAAAQATSLTATVMQPLPWEREPGGWVSRGQSHELSHGGHASSTDTDTDTSATTPAPVDDKGPSPAAAEAEAEANLPVPSKLLEAR